jgi:hypothetical protein
MPTHVTTQQLQPRPARCNLMCLRKLAVSPATPHPLWRDPTFAGWRPRGRASAGRA